MTAQATLNFPKFSRPVFGFSSKSRITAKTEENDEDWYIPYNGPYEVPRELPNRRKARDSWGDLLGLDDDEDAVFNDRELHLRYGGHNDSSYGDRHLEGERMGRRRDRTFSATSGQSVSSGTIDPSRPSIGYRRSTVSSGTRRVPPSYISMDATGGVGESPIPPRSSQERNRTTITSIFSLKTHSRKHSTHTTTSTRSATSSERTPSGNFVRKPSRSNAPPGHNKEKAYGNVDPPARYSSSPERANSLVKDKHERLRRQVMLYADRLNSVATESDYYNSYYSTLVHEQRSDINHRHRPSLSTSEDIHRSQQPSFDLNRQKKFFTKPAHPYARAIPQNNVEMPSKAPLIRLSIPPRPATSHNPNNKPLISSLTRFTSLRSPKLRNSSSTPDLRHSAVRHDAVVTPGIRNANLVLQPIATPQFVAPKGKDRWLSAETWCDAVVFPRPRLKSGIVTTLEGGSGRIVSPPGSPVQSHPNGFTGTQEPSVVSRVLAHSRSLMDLNKPAGSLSSYSYHPTSTSSAHERDPRAGRQSTTFAQDDLALATPVLSLQRVLEQGEQLANDRRAWQLQAQKSLGNKQGRTIIKARSKSLTNGRRRGHQPQSSLDYLAAQACLGNQNLHPSLSTTDLYATNGSSSRKSSHSKNTSVSKSSKSHSRNDSWSKPAMKMAMSTAAICGFPAMEDDVVVLDPGDTRGASLEGAIKGDGTKVIRLADPVHLPVDHRGPPPINTSPDSSIKLSPSPSNGSDQMMAIALGSPSFREDQSDLSFHPSHPYAQGGLSFSVPGPSAESRIDRGVEFAGPHPSINSGVDISQIPDNLARHKLPPHLYLHPYAQGSPRDSYFDRSSLLAQPRSDTPHQSKMWAQVSPGVVREVLPHDIQYSPFTPPPEDTMSPFNASLRNSIAQINDTMGLDETLANAEGVRRSDSSSTGTNDADADGDGDKQSENSLLLPEDLQPLLKQSLSNQNVSSHLKQQSPTPPLLSDRAVTTSPTATSTSSSPPLTPCRLGSLNDLEGFQDLFYRPSNELQRTPEAALPDTPSPPHLSTVSWDRVRRKSGLTSLARQLSQEFDLITRSSQHSSIQSPARQQRGTVSRQPTVRSLKLISEEASHPEPIPELDQHAIQAFQPSGSLPEDVESSRASSVIEGADSSDETAMLRLRIVEPILTPVTVSSPHRNSFTGETSSNNESRQDLLSPTSATGVSNDAFSQTFSGPNSPNSPVHRSSYTTTSTGSRISGLSDFPVPPKDHTVSLSSSYFNEPLPIVFTDQSFGSDQDTGDLAKTSSSSS